MRKLNNLWRRHQHIAKLLICISTLSSIIFILDSQKKQHIDSTQQQHNIYIQFPLNPEIENDPRAKEHDFKDGNIRKEDQDSWERLVKFAQCLHLLDEQLIPENIFDAIDEIVKRDTFVNTTTRNECNNGLNRKNDFAFLKNHFTGEELVGNILLRYAYNNDLSVVQPISINHSTLGWPHLTEPFMHQPPQTKNGKSNILLDYIIYNEEYFEKLLNKDAVYISIIQHPLHRLEDVFTEYLARNCSFMPDYIADSINATEQFLNNPSLYNTIYSSVENSEMYRKCYCMYGVSLTRNAMAFDLGFPTGYHMTPPSQVYNYTYILQWLGQLQEQIPVFIISDYLDLSLILLKRYMCWSNKDILYIEVGDNTRLHSDFSNHKYSFYKVNDFYHWSNVDTILYIFLNRTFWTRIEDMGYDDIMAERDVFLKQKDIVFKFCLGVQNGAIKRDLISVAGTSWENGYEVSAGECKDVFVGKQTSERLRREMWKRYIGGIGEKSQQYENHKDNSHFPRRWC